jgi:hypothetical protein
MAAVKLTFDYLKPEEINTAVEIETEGCARVIFSILSCPDLTPNRIPC